MLFDLWKFLKTTSKPFLVVFYAPWCEFSKTLNPEYSDGKLEIKNFPSIFEMEPNIKNKYDKLKTLENFVIEANLCLNNMHATITNVENFWKSEDDTHRVLSSIDSFTVRTKLLSDLSSLNYLCSLEKTTPINCTPALVDYVLPQHPSEKPWSQESNNIVHLTSNNFASYLRNRKHVLVAFYVPWCKYCQEFKPEFVKAAEKFKTDPNIQFAAIDCSTNPSICSVYDIKGYPTFKYFNYYDKTIKTYKGGRTYDDFVTFMNHPDKPSAPVDNDEWMLHSSILRLNDRNFKKEVASKNIVLVMFYAPWCKYCNDMKPHYAAAAKILASEGFSGCLAMLDCIDNPETADEFQISGFPTIKLFKNGSFLRDYTGKRSQQEIASFVKEYLKVAH